MSILGEIRSLFMDTFLTLPLLILGFIFFFGTLTSNVGLLYLLIGHAALVPALSLLSDPASNPFLGGSVISGVQSVVSLLLVLWTQSHALGGGNNYYMFFLIVVPYMCQAFGFKKSVMFFYNPIGWARATSVDDEAPQESSQQCALIPGGKPRRNPSAWISHMAFLYGFVSANANTIMNEPTPTIAGPKNVKGKSTIDKRVSNRKNRAFMVMLTSFIIFACIIGIRYYTFHECEGQLLYSLIPIIITALTGACWFLILYNDCGIRPADILGIVQGMVSPRMAENPIVCVGD